MYWMFNFGCSIPAGSYNSLKLIGAFMIGSFRHPNVKMVFHLHNIAAIQGSGIFNMFNIIPSLIFTVVVSGAFLPANFS